MTPEEEEELARVALEEPAQHVEPPRAHPGVGRLLVLLAFALLSLGTVFLWRR